VSPAGDGTDHRAGASPEQSAGNGALAGIVGRPRRPRRVTGAASVTPSILRLMIAAIIGAIFMLCSLAIERVTGDKKTAVLREHPPEMVVRGSSVPSTPAEIQPGWSNGPSTR